MAEDYHEEMKIKNTLMLRERLKELPPFIAEFFRGISETTLARTRINYAYDYKVFFDFLLSEGNIYEGKQMRSLTLSDLALVSADDLEAFTEYLSYYIKDEDGKEVERHNEEKGKARKLSAVRSLFSYFYKKRKIPANPAELVDLPKIHEKVIVKLEVDEIAKLLDTVESGEHLTEHMKKIHRLTQARDLAIITLLLGTGMRVSECVGINLEHIDFEQSAIKITRKGGDESLIYFGSEVEEALNKYLDIREDTVPLEGHESALFISLQRKRLTVRAIQILVKKYSSLITGLKKISPHKLRSTYGTNLYRETGDIYLVAEVLGHKDVNTTKKHYADLGEDRKRMAANVVKLRKD